MNGVTGDWHASTETCRLIRLGEDKTMEFVEIFNEFVKVIKTNPDYVIGLLNEAYELIYASQPELVGQRVNQDTPQERIYPLALPNHFFGYLWVKNLVDDNALVPELLYESFRTRLVYEVGQEHLSKHLSIDDKIIHCLINEDIYNVKMLLSNNFISSDCYRIPIYIRSRDPMTKEFVANLKYKCHDRDTLCSLLGETELLVLKRVPDQLLDGTYMEMIQDFIQEVEELGFTKLACYVGMALKRLDQFGIAIDALRDFLVKHPIRQGTCFLVNHLLELDHQMMGDIYDIYLEQLKPSEYATFVSLADALYANNFHLANSADALFIHKNTLSYQLRRFESKLHTDLHETIHGKILFKLIAIYLKERMSDQ